jgi:hypothetical protein
LVFFKSRYGGSAPVRQQRNPTEGKRTALGGAGVEASHCRPGERITDGTTELSMKLGVL